MLFFQLIAAYIFCFKFSAKFSSTIFFHVTCLIFFLYVNLEHGTEIKQRTTIGLLLTTIGSPASLQAKKLNFFTHEIDTFVTDPATGKKLYDHQKPVSFYNELMDLLSTKDDWILSAPTGIGMFV